MTTDGSLDSAVLVDATGKRCPLPIIDLARAAGPASPGTLIRLLSTDPAAEPDVAAWCRLLGHELVDQHWSADPAPPTGQDQGRVLSSTVRIRRTPARAVSAEPPAGRSGTRAD